MKSKKGSLVIVALWALFSLSCLAAAIYAYVVPQISLAGRLKNRVESYYLAKAGAKKAIYLVSAYVKNINYNSLNEEWSNSESLFKNIALGSGSFSVINDLDSNHILYGVVDEERKININQVPEPILKNFFILAAGVSPSQAEGIADCIIDWRDSDNIASAYGAEDAYYKTLSPGYPCKNSSFEALEELLLVKGMDNDIFDKVRNRITIYGTGKININTADRIVLLSLGLDSSLVDKIITFRKGEDEIEATPDDNIFMNKELIVDNLLAKEQLSDPQKTQLAAFVNSGLFVTRGEYFIGKSVGTAGSSLQTSQIVFIFDRNKTLKYWRED